MESLIPGKSAANPSFYSSFRVVLNFLVCSLPENREMLIIGNIKDYYDYLAGVYGVDKHIVFDRRKFVPLPGSLNEIIRHRIFGKLADDYTPRTLPEYVHALLEIGTIQYFFRLNLKWSRRKASKDLFGNYEVADIVWELLEKWDNHIHIGGEKDIVTLALSGDTTTVVSRSGKWVKFGWRETWWNLEPDMREMIDSLNGGYMDFVARNFILSDLGIQKIIPVEEVWRGIYSYLSFLKTPKFEDKRTDKEKLTNKGFDMKTSFRH